MMTRVYFVWWANHPPSPFFSGSEMGTTQILQDYLTVVSSYLCLTRPSSVSISAAGPGEGNGLEHGMINTYQQAF